MGLLQGFRSALCGGGTHLGIGARVVSGYLLNPDVASVGVPGSGSTHAWAEIFLPGAGWITFDPPSRSIGGFNLIPVAVARDIAQVVPVAGSFVGYRMHSGL